MITYPQPFPSPFYQAIKTLMKQAIAAINLEALAVDKVTGEKAFTNQAKQLIALYELIAIIVSNLLRLETALSHAVRNIDSEPQAVIPALRRAVNCNTVSVESVLNKLFRLLTEPQLRLIGPLCWSIAGGEVTIKSIMAQLGLLTCSETQLVQATLDACLDVLRAVETLPVTTPSLSKVD